MKRFLLGLFAANCCLGASAPKVEVNVVVDMTPAGRAVRPPTPGHPVYYLPVVAGYRSLGAQIAGEPPPPTPREVARLVAVALAKAGYFVTHPSPYENDAGQITFADGVVVKVPARPSRWDQQVFDPSHGIPLTMAMISAPSGPYSLSPTAAAPVGTTTDAHEGLRKFRAAYMQAMRTGDPVHGAIIARVPTIILVIHYGSANPVIMEAPGGGNVIMNQSEMLGLVGGNTLDHLDLEFEREPVMQGAEQNRYFVAVTAYDFATYVHTRKKTMLWQAKMSVPDHRVYFRDVVAALTDAGAPYFGHEMIRPKQFVVPSTPEGHVEVGTPVVKPGPTD